MVNLSGVEQFDEAAATVWQSLVDPRFLCRCFPGVDSVVRADDRSAELVVRPGFSFLRGTLGISFEFVETVPTSRGRVSIEIKGIGSWAKVESSFELTETESETQVAWKAEIRELGGLLKAVSQGLLQAAAQRVAADTWQEIRRNLSAAK